MVHGVKLCKYNKLKCKKEECGGQLVAAVMPVFKQQSPANAKVGP